MLRIKLEKLKECEADCITSLLYYIIIIYYTVIHCTIVLFPPSWWEPLPTHSLGQICIGLPFHMENQTQAYILI